VATKVALLCPDEIITLAGTLNAALLLFNAIVPAAREALFKAMVHVLDALLLIVEGEQDTEEICAGAMALKVKVLDGPLKEAVIVAVWFELMFPTVTANEALL
jgi:hypothetical protein